MGRQTPDDLTFLNTNCMRDLPPDSLPISLFPTNKPANEMNVAELHKLTTPDVIYKKADSWSPFENKELENVCVFFSLNFFVRLGLLP